MTAVASAFARANLIGEHTDYNDGFVLPTLLPLATEVRIEKFSADEKSIFITSAMLGQSRVCDLDAAPAKDWTDYVMACLFVLRKRAIAVPSMRIQIASDIPMGAGISSSAALLVATLRALRLLIGFNADDRALAIMAHEAERDYVGVPCGIMDQFVCALGSPDHALMLDTLQQTYDLVRLPDDQAVMLVNCGKKHRLAAGDGYRQRVAECQQACRELGVRSLRELTDKDLDHLQSLPDILRRRVRHVVTENRRVLDAAEALLHADMARFARLMAESHDSQRDDYDVSIPEIDNLVDASRRFGIQAARLTGGGFGGSIVGLVPRGQTQAWWEALKKDNPASQLISGG